MKKGKKITKVHYDQLPVGQKKMYKAEDISFEGTQYRGGRGSERKNLIKLDNGSVKNQYGVVFTQEEKKRLESLVNSANAKRRRQLKEESVLPRMVGNTPTGQTNQSLHIMGNESDFIITRKTKSLQRYRRKDDFDRYIAYLERVNSKDYTNMRIQIYKNNYVSVMKDRLGHDADDIIHHVEKMPLKDFKKFIQTHVDDIDIPYIYSKEDKQVKMNYLRSALKLPVRDEDDYIDDI